MILHYKNYIDNDTIITAENYPVNQETDKIKDYHLSSTFTQVNNYPTLPYLVFNLNAFRNIKSVVIDRGNLVDTCTCKLYRSNDGITFTYISDMVMTETVFYSYCEVNTQYIKIEFIENTGNQANVTIGYVHIGDYITLPGLEPSSELSLTTTSQSTVSLSGQIYGYVSYDYKSYIFNFPLVSDDNYTYGSRVIANRKAIINAFNEVKNINPMYAFLWEASLNEFPPLFCIFNQSTITFKKKLGSYYSTSISLLEVK